MQRAFLHRECRHLRCAPRAVGVSRPWQTFAPAGWKRTPATAPVHATRSGWRRPVVPNVTHPPVGNAHQQRHPFTRPGAVWRKPAVRVRRGRPVRTKTLAVAGALLEPRRADARRSCACAFVHRKWHYFAGGPSASQYKSGGRKPPVVTITVNATAIRTYTVGGLQNKRAVCLRNRVSHTHGGLTPAALGRAFAGRRT
jgi:hypothetical protein